MNDLALVRMPHFTSALIGESRSAQLGENVKLLNAGPLKPAEHNEFEVALKSEQPTWTGDTEPMQVPPPPPMSEPTHSLAQFLAATAERDNPGDVFELESPKMLEARVRGRIWSKLGAMVAYRGNIKFVREGMMEGGLGKAFMKALSGEMSPLTKVEGDGLVYLADSGKEVTVLRLQGESINVSGNDLLAFEDSVQYEITMHRRVAGMLAGGLFSARMTGSGLVAIVTHGRPLTLRVTPDDPVCTDPNATVAWSGNLTPEIKTDITIKSVFGRGGGESFQMLFRGEGFVVVQPFEEVPAVSGSSG